MNDSVAYDSLLRHFRESPPPGPAWLDRLRKEAIAEFEALGLPTRTHEDWRFTNLSGLADTELVEAFVAPPLSESWVESTHKAVGAEIRLVFANGLFRPELSQLATLPEGARVASIAEILEQAPELIESSLGQLAETKNHPLVALNTALFRDGAWIDIGAGTTVSDPIHLVFVQTGGDTHIAAHPRVLIHAAANSHATVVEHYIGEAPRSGLTNPVTEIRVERDAHLEHVSLQERRLGSFHLGSIDSYQESGSHLGSHSIAIGEGVARLEIRSCLGGEGAHVDMNGLYLVRDRQHVDHHTTIDHAMPRTTSKELYKGILDERGRGVFHGRIHVRPDAQKIDAQQTNRALLLSDGAQINSKPQLEIHADDVKCSHGASVGQLDEDHLFYLRSRGLSFEDARSILTFAFASEVVEALPLEPLRDYLKYAILRWLPGGIQA